MAHGREVCGTREGGVWHKAQRFENLQALFVRGTLHLVSCKQPTLSTCGRVNADKEPGAMMLLQ